MLKPSNVITIGLFSETRVLNTNTAFPVGAAVVKISVVEVA